MLRQPHDRNTLKQFGTTLPDNQPDSTGAAAKYFDSDRKIARDFQRAFNEDGKESLSVQFRRYQSW